MKNNLNLLSALLVDGIKNSVIDELKNNKENLQERPQAFDDRTVQVLLRNETSLALKLELASVSIGEWLDHPPETIESFTTGIFKSVSNTWLMGITGHTVYMIDDGDDNIVDLEWDNPYIGSNFYLETVTGDYTITRDGGDGNNAVVTWTLRQA